MSMLPPRPSRPDAAPALSRLLAESSLSRSALGACGLPLALVEATGRTPAVCYVNAAFLAFFGYRESEALGKPVAALLFRNDEALVRRLLGESPRRWEIGTWGKSGEPRPVEASVAAVRDCAGTLTHWVLAFTDRMEVERLRAEVESLKSLAAASLAVRLEPAGEPARGAQEPRIEVAPADELNADRQARSVL
jgi:PAS domain S-box-containing protein